MSRVRHSGKTYALLTPAHLVRVVYERIEGTREVIAVFGCVSCGGLLDWDRAKGLWSCPDCEQELSPEEARYIVEHSREALKMLAADVKQREGGRTWGWARWFRRLLRATAR